MAIPNSQKLVWQPRGCSDAKDSRDAFPGAMQKLADMVPDPSTMDVWVPRPASVLLTSFGGFNTPGFVSGLIVVGDICYGMIASARNAAHDEPFAFNLKTTTFETVTGILAGNTPTSPATSGDWTPPVLFVCANRIIVTHPGFSGANKFGWFDISNFSSATITGSTHATTTVDTLSANPITAGWDIGMAISDASGDIPAGATIVSMTATSVVISAAATGSHTLDTLTVTGGTTTSPQWAAGDTNTNNLPSIPVGGFQMNGRAYFACGTNGIPFSDALHPTSRTNASQALTTNDGLAVTAIGPIGASQTAGGSPIVSGLVVFQGSTKMQLITGDSATSNLQINVLPVATGTLAPLSLFARKQGLGFISPDGMRTIDVTGNVSSPIGDHGTGITVPFVNAVNPSRMNAASNADTIRTIVNNGAAAGGTTTQEWDYNITRECWHGPHSFPFDQIDIWNNTFVITPHGVTAKLFQSDIRPTSTTTYTENGTALSWTWQTCLLPDSDDMSMTSIVQATSMIARGATSVTTVAANESAVLDTVTIAGMDTATIWDVAKWDVDVWDGTGTIFGEHLIPWHTVILFKQGSFQINALSIANQRVGCITLRYQRIPYVLQSAA